MENAEQVDMVDEDQLEIDDRIRTQLRGIMSHNSVAIDRLQRQLNIIRERDIIFRVVETLKTEIKTPVCRKSLKSILKVTFLFKFILKI